MIASQNSNQFLESLLRRDRIILLFSLVLICGLSWFYLIDLAVDMEEMRSTMKMAMYQVPAWSLKDFMFLFMMWTVMMVGMMTPSATPMILTFSAVYKKRKERSGAFVSTWIFLLGYLLSWAGFSLFAALIQWSLKNTAMLSPFMSTQASLLGGLILISAGVYQLTPLKNMCLIKCQNPLFVIMDEWREGKLGTLIMGIRNGFFCVGCCWVLMLILFVTGVMNLIWVAIITLFVLIEKVAPAARMMKWVTGSLLIIWGLVVTLGLST